MNRILTVVLLMSIALVVMVGCGQAAPEPAAAPEEEMAGMEGMEEGSMEEGSMEEGSMMTMKTVTGDGLTVELRGMPPLSASKVTTLEFYLSDAQGNPVTGADIALDLDMTAMEMPENKPKVTEVGEGVYQAPAKLGMASDTWFLTLDINHNGQASTITIPDIEVGK